MSADTVHCLGMSSNWNRWSNLHPACVRRRNWRKCTRSQVAHANSTDKTVAWAWTLLWALKTSHNVTVAKESVCQYIPKLVFRFTSLDVLLHTGAFCRMQASMFLRVFCLCQLHIMHDCQSTKCCYDGVYPSCTHSACSNTYFVRAAVVCIKGKKYSVWDAAQKI